MKNFFRHTLFTLSICLFALPAFASRVNCEKILSVKSTTWVNQVNAKIKRSSTLATLKAIQVYNNCYQQKLDSTKALLTKMKRAPLMGATAEFNDFQQALDAFTKTALQAKAGGGSYDRIKAAYANLYAKQFRDDFYQMYLKPKFRFTVNKKQLRIAKDHLQKLLQQLPPEQAKQLQDEISNLHKLATATRSVSTLKLYNYVISLLQSPADPPFAPSAF